MVGDARELLPRLDAGSVQCVVTSSPYWGMRVYDNERNVRWADGESCPDLDGRRHEGTVATARCGFGAMRRNLIALLGHACLRQRAERSVGRRRKLSVWLRGDPWMGSS